MDLIVSDTNVFVALHKCGLLFKVFSNTRVSIQIPIKIYDELTSANHRIYSEYNELSQLIIGLRFNPNHGHPISLTVSDIQKTPLCVEALTAYYTLKSDAFLDPGEQEAIPLAIELSATFVSCDIDAITEHQAIVEKKGSSGITFTNYCTNLLASAVINQNEFAQLTQAQR